MARSFGEGKSGQVKERRKGKKGKRKKEKSQKANHGKDWQHIAKETNQVSLFPFTNKQKKYSYRTTNITSVELIRNKTE